ncbi:hypothetical protein QWY89_06800 [Mucilaginibacter myungsuensis]|nr:hypothetical protein [Mucilaginibacter myungsuensis]MDN3598351.1 hypothetical protein [Mucilaginibacter myungsuensis]
MVSFLYGKRSLIANYSYPMPGVAIWRSQRPGSRSTTVCKIVTLPSGKTDYFITWELMDADTTSRVLSRFFYDKDSLLVAAEDSRLGKPYQVTNYQYKDKRLVMAEFKTLSSPNTRWIGLIYDKEHLLQKQIQYGLRGSIVDSTTIGTYEYLGKNIFAQTRPDGSDPNKMIRTTYAYDLQSRIVGLSATLDTLYQKIIYEYKDKYLSRTTVSTNTGRTLAPGFYSPYINYSNKASVTLVTTYNYDNKGYLVRTEETLNGVLQSRRQNVIEYY